MSFTIEHGPRDKRQVVRGLKLDQIAKKAEELTKAGAVNVKILSPTGNAITLDQFKLDLHSRFG